MYKPGPKNKALDALLCQMGSVEFRDDSISLLWVDFPTIHTKIQQDTELSKLPSQIQNDPASMLQYVQGDGLVFFKGHLVLPKTYAIILALLVEFHSTAKGGHLGFTKTYKCMAANFY